MKKYFYGSLIILFFFNHILYSAPQVEVTKILSDVNLSSTTVSISNTEFNVPEATVTINASQVADLKNVVDISNSGLQTYYINISSTSVTSVSATGKDIEFSVIGTGNCTFNLNGGSNIYLSDDFSRAFNSENWGKGINETLTINITELEAGATVQASIIYKK